MATTGQRIPKSTGLSASILEERRALLQRVLWSRQIEKSARIRDFLVYVCERALREPSVEIHEQEIGYRVFGRAPDYDTTADNIVRVTASQARKKIEQYFASEGASEPVILEIPKGHYVPVFRERDVTNAEPGAREPIRRGWVWRGVVVLAACAPLLAVVAGWSLVKLRSERLAGRSELEANPAVHALWSQLLPRGGRTDVVVSDSSLSLFQELLDHQLTLSEYLKPDLWMPSGGMSQNPDLRLFAQRAAQRQFTSLASVTTAYRIAQIAGKDQSHISISSARNFNVRQMKSDNVILLGSTRANPWAELIEDRLNFRFGFDQQSRYAYFENRDPRPGELKLYRTDSGVSFCQIAFLPNLGKTGNILAISGTETEGTEGGGEFITNERSIEQIQSIAKSDRDGRLPYFEILLKSSRVGGAAPNFSIVVFRLVT